jgi:hypothetical protein
MNIVRQAKADGEHQASLFHTEHEDTIQVAHTFDATRPLSVAIIDWMASSHAAASLLWSLRGVTEAACHYETGRGIRKKLTTTVQMIKNNHQNNNEKMKNIMKIRIIIKKKNNHSTVMTAKPTWQICRVDGTLRA